MWTLCALVLTWLPARLVFVRTFCGSDLDAICEQRYTAGWAVIAVTIAATLALSFLFRRRFVIVVAVLCVPAQVWYYLAIAIPTAATLPN